MTDINDQHHPTISKTQVAAVILGNAVEFFDFSVYAIFAVLIGEVFFPSHSVYLSVLLSVSVFGVGFVARPLGAIWIGSYADRHGRKPAMLLTLLLMTVGTAGMAILPGYDTLGIMAPILLIVVRLLQGIAWGGEAGPATTFILEAAPLNLRGTYACWQVVAQGIAAIVGALVGYIMMESLDKNALLQWGWRIPFIFGLLILPIGLYLRRHLNETLIVSAPKPKTSQHLSDLWHQHRRALLIGLMILSGSTITQYFLNYMTTFAITVLHLPMKIAMLPSLFGGLTLMISAIFGGVLSDRYGRRAIIIMPRLIFLILLFPAMWLIIHTQHVSHFLWALSILSFLHGMSGAALVVLIAESFPHLFRSIGFSLVYAVGVTVFGGTTQIILTWLLELTQNSMSMAFYVFIANIVCVLAAYLSKETCPKFIKKNIPIT